MHQLEDRVPERTLAPPLTSPSVEPHAGVGGAPASQAPAPGGAPASSALPPLRHPGSAGRLMRDRRGAQHMYAEVLEKRASFLKLQKEASPVAAALEARKEPSLLRRLLTGTLRPSEREEWARTHVIDLDFEQPPGAPAGRARFPSGGTARVRPVSYPEVEPLSQEAASALAVAELGRSLLFQEHALSGCQVADVNDSLRRLHAAKMASGHHTTAFHQSHDRRPASREVEADMESVLSETGTCMYMRWAVGGESEDARRACGSLAGMATHERYRDANQPTEEQYLQFPLVEKYKEAEAVLTAMQAAYEEALVDLNAAPASASQLPVQLLSSLAYRQFGLPGQDRILIVQANRSDTDATEHHDEPGPGAGQLPPLPPVPEADDAERAAAVKQAVKVEQYLNRFHSDLRGGDGVGKFQLVIQTSGHESEVVFLHPLNPYAPIFVLKLHTCDAYAMLGAGATVFDVLTDGAAREKYRHAIQYKPQKASLIGCRAIACEHPACRGSLTLRVGINPPGVDDVWWRKWEGSEALAAKAELARTLSSQ